MKKYAVAGSPIFHSKSPELFNYFSKYKNKESIYSRICSDSAEDVMSIVKELNFTGLNITTPLKKTIIPFLDDLTDEAKTINSVNTITYDKGRYIGHNTDYIGIVKALETSGVIINDKQCLVLGAGGAARAAVYGLIKAGGKVTITNRNLKKAEDISKDLNCENIDFNDLAKRAQGFDIIISTIPNDSKILSTLPMTKSQVILSADYKQEIGLNKECEKPRMINGLLWLIFQGAASFKLFTGKEAEKIDIKKLKILLNRKHIKNKTSLIGFAGSGKTTIAKNLNIENSIDIDGEIEKDVKLSIPEIFKKMGEQYFRNIERPLLRKFILDPKTKLISCGGGILLNKKNSEILINHTNTIWLWTPLNIIKIRISGISRPLLKTSEDVESLFSEREDDYFKAANMIIPNTAKDNGIDYIIGLLKNEILF